MDPKLESGQWNRTAGRAWLASLMVRDPGHWSSRLGALLSWMKMIGRGQRRRFGRAAAGVLAGASGIALMAMLAGPMGQPWAALPAQAAGGDITVDGTCTLIDAIKAANTDAIVGSCDGTGSDMIILSADLTYSAAYSGDNALPTVTSGITINGGGFTIARSSVGGTPNFRLFEVGGTGNLTLSDVTVSNGFVGAGGYGGAIYVQQDGQLTLSGATLSGNGADGRGGGIFSAGTMTINNSQILSNTAATKGGGVFSTGTTTINNSQVLSKTTLNYGGGIYSSGPMTIVSGTISGNNTGNTNFSRGGGIYAKNHPLTLEDSTVSGNAAQDAGGGIYIIDADLALTNTAVISNLGSIYLNGFNGAIGGGIYAKNGDVTVTDSDVSANTVPDVSDPPLLIGAGMSVGFGTLTVSGSTINNNSGGPSGASSAGGIRLVGTPAMITDTTISGNSTAVFGSGISGESSPVAIYNSTISGNSAGSGGGMMLRNNSSLKLTNSQVLSNTSSGGGGGVGVNRGDAPSPTPIYATIDNSTISGTAARFGGGLDLTGWYLDTLPLVVTITDSIISNNEAKGAGALNITYVDGLVSNTEITGNSANTWSGGVAYFWVSNLTVDKSVIDGNSAAGYGGGLDLYYGTNTLTVTNSTIDNNTAGTGGAAIHVKSGHASVLDSTIQGNEATTYGGGIAVKVDGSATITGTQIRSNTAGTTGGGVYTAGATTITGTVISGNMATTKGGGIYTLAKLTINDTSVLTNFATTHGGGVFATGGATQVTIDSSTFSDNETSLLLPFESRQGKGGAVYVTGLTDLTISDSSFTGNASRWQGGAIYAGYTTTDISTSSISGNYSLGSGGGIFAISGSRSMTVKYTTFDNNNADNWGGGLFLRGASHTLVNNTISSNSAGFYGGGIYSDATSLTLSHNTIVSNTADISGGGLYTWGKSSGLVTLNHNLISGNSAATNGDEIARWDASYPLTSQNNLIGDSRNTNAQALFKFTPAASDVTATSDGDDPTALSGIVKPLADNGGLGTLPGSENTMTHLLAAGSPAIDILLGTECEIEIDQRGDERPKGVGCDAGAVEAGGGLIKISKLTTPAGLLDVFEFTSDIDGSETFSLSHGETETMTVPSGIFTVTETVAEGFNLDDLSCTDGGEVEGDMATITINEGDEVSCTFTNAPATGTLEIGKIITPTGLTDSFTFTVTDGAAVTEVFELTGGMTETITLPVGAFTVTEALVDGFELIDVDCGGGDKRDGRTGVSNEVEVTIANDQTTSCTFTNEVIEDEDGVDPTTEGGAPNGGDGNGDGTPDYLQNHVTSLPNGQNEKYVSIAAPDGTQMTAVSTGPAPADLPDGVVMPIGVINFSLTNLPANGATVTVTLHLQDGITADTYYKLVNGVWTEYENVEFVDDKTIVLTLTDGGAGDLDGVANGTIVDPGGPGRAPTDADIFISTWTAGKVGALTYGPHDVLGWDGDGWTTWFAGAAAGLDPMGKWKHNLNAIWISDTEDSELIFSLTQDNRAVPGIPGIVDGMDLLRWDGDAFSLWFDGQDVGLNVKTQEKIDGLHILDEAPAWSEFSGQRCEAYLLISIQGNGLVPKPGNVKPKNAMKFGGEDVVGFCATNLGTTTTGFWELVLDGSTYKVLKNNIESLAANEDASVLYLTSQKQFRVHEAFGGHSMVFAFDMETERFSGPYVRVMDDLGIQPKVDALHVSGELELD